jgi:hypothetical protein
MLMYAFRKPVETKVRIWIGIAAIVVLALGAFTWVRMEDETRWQAETLVKIRGVIGRGVMRHYMSEGSLKTLDEFYQQRGPQKASLKEIFCRENPKAAVGVNIHKPEWANDLWQLIVTKLEPGTIELCSQETYVKGRDSLFKNYNGQLGMIQEKVTLTEKGITHVSEN